MTCASFGLRLVVKTQEVELSSGLTVQYSANTGADHKNIDAVNNAQSAFIGFILPFNKDQIDNTWP